MEITTDQDLRTFPLHIDDYGRFVIPAESKIRKACRNGERLVAVENEEVELSIRRERKRGNAPASESRCDWTGQLGQVGWAERRGRACGGLRRTARLFAGYY